MTNPTNWPNPERPGVPMFPERDGFHIIGKLAWKWHAASELWDGVANPDEFGTFYYVGPCLAPTQIAELLAGERERCCDIVANRAPGNFHELPERDASIITNMAEDICEAIRKLGAAP